MKKDILLIISMITFVIIGYVSVSFSNAEAFGCNYCEKFTELLELLKEIKEILENGKR